MVQQYWDLQPCYKWSQTTTNLLGKLTTLTTHVFNMHIEVYILSSMIYVNTSKVEYYVAQKIQNLSSEGQ